jgi:hypothetical protein
MRQCVRTSDTAKCERCTGLAYPCFGAISSAISSSPKRVLNRRKCDYCRDAKQKVILFVLVNFCNTNFQSACRQIVYGRQCVIVVVIEAFPALSLELLEREEQLAWKAQCRPAQIIQK